MNNIQKFTTAADYSAATHSYPNVSWITSGDTLIYTAEDPTPPSNIPSLDGFDVAVTYNVTDASQEVQLTTTEYNANTIIEMSVDGVDETPSSTYRFDTTGHHIVRYKIDESEDYNTLFQTFKEVPNMLYVHVGGNIWHLEETAFAYMDSSGQLLEIQLDADVYDCRFGFFMGNSNLEKFIVLNTTPPDIYSEFLYGMDNCNIYVPSESVNDYKAASGWSYYADRIFPIQ